MNVREKIRQQVRNPPISAAVHRCHYFLLATATRTSSPWPLRTHKRNYHRIQLFGHSNREFSSHTSPQQTADIYKTMPCHSLHLLTISFEVLLAAVHPVLSKAIPVLF